jgi:hypothetical protein
VAKIFSATDPLAAMLVLPFAGYAESQDAEETPMLNVVAVAVLLVSVIDVELPDVMLTLVWLA